MPEELKIVPEDKEFKFKGLCPYCGGDLTYTVTGWEEDDECRWMADSFDSSCSNEPPNILSEEWDEWLAAHSDMPYVHQLPVDQRVKEWINQRYRFELK